MYVQTRRDGGWAYTDGAGLSQPTQTMTAAALCGLYLADRHLGKPDEAATAALRAGLADWAKRYGREDGKSVFYQWYGTARLGRLAGKKAIPGPNGKDANWYQDGVAWLVKNQDKDADVRRGAAIGLGYLGDGAKEAIPALQAALKDRDVRVREAAGVALFRIDPSRFTDPTRQPHEGKGV